MGIHAGEPEVSGDRYVGLAVSRASRISAAGHGGQVLLSSSARALLGDDEETVLPALGSPFETPARRDFVSQGFSCFVYVPALGNVDLVAACKK